MFWYNVTLRKGTEESSVPSNLLFQYPWRVSFDVSLCTGSEEVKSSFLVEDEVWVKPSLSSCTKQWMPGKVTRIVSKHTVCMDGMPRHVRDIRQQCSGVHRGSHGRLQVDDLRGRSVAIEPLGVLFALFPCGDGVRLGFLSRQMT